MANQRKAARITSLSACKTEATHFGRSKSSITLTWVQNRHSTTTSQQDTRPKNHFNGLDVLVKELHELEDTANYILGSQTYVDLSYDIESRAYIKVESCPLYLSRTPAGFRVHLVRYADDFIILTSETDLVEMFNKWLNSMSLILSPGMTATTLFTTWTQEVESGKHNVTTDATSQHLFQFISQDQGG